MVIIIIIIEEEQKFRQPDSLVGRPRQQTERELICEDIVSTEDRLCVSCVQNTAQTENPKRNRVLVNWQVQWIYYSYSNYQYYSHN